MMVASIVLTATEGQRLAKGDELGYFKFGGSTIVLVAQSERVVLDKDLCANSDACIETLVQVGVSVARAAES